MHVLYLVALAALVVLVALVASNPRQIIDTGLDESSCYFIDEDGGEVDHGYYFDEIGFTGDGSHASQNLETLFNGGDFTFDLERRKAGLAPSIIPLLCLDLWMMEEKKAIHWVAMDMHIRIHSYTLVYTHE